MRRQTDHADGAPASTNVVDLIEALRRSVGKQAAPAKAANAPKKPRKAAAGQKEMLMSNEGRSRRRKRRRKATKAQRESA